VLGAPESVVAHNGGVSPAVRLALRVSVPREAVVDMITGAAGGEAATTREVLTAEGSLTVPVLSGLGDPAAAPAGGPAFLRAPDTTIFVPPGWSVTFTSQGYGILSREGST
jgi:N-methylhydantoinase A/oxoprolinase/acetone carboxylase beta subunit